MFFRQKVRNPTLGELKAQAKDLDSKVKEVKLEKELKEKIKVNAKKLKQDKFEKDNPVLSKVLGWAKKQGKVQVSRMKARKAKNTSFLKGNTSPFSASNYSSSDSSIFTSGGRNIFYDEPVKNKKR